MRVVLSLALQVLRLRRRFNAIHSDYLDSRLSVIAEVNAKRKRCGEIKEVRATQCRSIYVKLQSCMVDI